MSDEERVRIRAADNETRGEARASLSKGDSRNYRDDDQTGGRRDSFRVADRDAHRAARSRSKAQKPFADKEKHPDVAILSFWESSKTIEKNDALGRGSHGTCLKPISDKEISECIARYREVMDRTAPSTSCGVQVILKQLEQPISLPLRILKCLELSDDQLATYKSTPSSIRGARSVTAVGLGYFALHRCYVDTPMDQVVTLDSLAYLCQSCKSVCATNHVPKFSFKNGIDYENPEALGLPALTFVEKSMLSPVRLYGHIVKMADGGGRFALKLHVMAIETDLHERIADFSDKGTQFPHLNPDVSVAFVGQLEKR